MLNFWQGKMLSKLHRLEVIMVFHWSHRTSYEQTCERFERFFHHKISRSTVHNIHHRKIHTHITNKIETPCTKPIQGVKPKKRGYAKISPS